MTFSARQKKLIIIILIGISVSLFIIQMLMNHSDLLGESNQMPSIEVAEIRLEGHSFDDCPDDFFIPDCSVEIWQDLSEFGFNSNCDQRNCSKCIPPNSQSAHQNKLYHLWYNETYLSKKEYRQRSITTLLNVNHIEKGHDHNPVILMVFNYGFSYLFLNWVCSLDSNQISYLRRNTLIVVSDYKSKELAVELLHSIWLRIRCRLTLCEYGTMTTNSVRFLMDLWQFWI